MSAASACVELPESNESCSLRFEGSALRLRRSALAEEGEVALHDGNGTLQGVATEGTQYVVLTEGLGMASYVLPKRASRYVIPPSEGLAGGRFKGVPVVWKGFRGFEQVVEDFKLLS